MRRLRRELETIQKTANPQITVRPSPNNLLEWHFALHDLPADTPYCDGCYHGKVIFPADYPHKPPSIIMVTKSGRLQVGVRVCLSMTDYHPESWNPAWSVDTILVGFVSFFLSDKEGGVGSLKTTLEKRRVEAAESWAKNADNPEFRELFPEHVRRGVDIHAPAQPAEAAGGSGSIPTELTAQADRSTQPLPALETGAADVPEAPSADDSNEANAGREGRTEEELEEEPAECWICRDVDSEEPLVHPCACRGTMSGVHASCVEQWISHHRRTARNNRAPQCSVCHQPYAGSDQRPGFSAFASHGAGKCWVALKLASRGALIVFAFFFFVVYVDAPECPLSIKGLFVAVITLYALFKAAILLASLPFGRPPPQQTCLQYFFVEQEDDLVMHICEPSCFILLVVFAWNEINNQVYFLPFFMIFSIPVIKFAIESLPFCVQSLSLTCLRDCLLQVGMFILSPILLIGICLWVIIRHPARIAQHVLHPLNAGLHLLVAFVTYCISLFAIQDDDMSNVPVVIMWASHSVLVLGAVVELWFVKRLRWRKGQQWWGALFFTVFAAAFANMPILYHKGFGEQTDDTDTVVHAVSCTWAVLVVCLAVSVNWTLLGRNYRVWQSRNGRFTLDVAATNAGEVPLVEAQAEA